MQRHSILETLTTTARKLPTSRPIGSRLTPRESHLAGKRCGKCRASWFSTLDPVRHDNRTPPPPCPSSSASSLPVGTAPLTSPPQEVSHPRASHDHPSILSVDDLATSMRHQVREYVRNVRRPSRIKLVGILAVDHDRPSSGDGTNLDAETYASRIEETLAEDGIDFEVSRCSNHSPELVEAAIRAANVRPDVHGILVFYPIFKRRAAATTSTATTTKAPYLNQSTGVHYKSHDDYLRDVVDPTKDVEGLSTSAAAKWVFQARDPQRKGSPLAAATTTDADQVATGSPPVDVYIPCTAMAVLKVLETYGNTSGWSGTTVTVVNRSEIFGRPLAAALALRGATVYSVDDRSVLVFREGGRNVVRQPRDDDSFTLDSCLKRSSVVVTGVPCPDFCLPVSSLAPGTLIVNVSEFPNVDEDELLQSCPNVRLVPHIGKVTVAALEQNLVRLHRQQQQQLLENKES